MMIKYRLEIRGAAGGDEAALFAGDLQMYQNTLKAKVEILSWKLLQRCRRYQRSCCHGFRSISLL